MNPMQTERTKFPLRRRIAERVETGHAGGAFIYEFREREMNNIALHGLFRP